ncbi:hypothetical protein LTR37_008739 [Vermiconidia calcicola]|uniref:Uncharacterized protein n=1 Tax=Vermiconidia calcicola TaxID=1690605 RepID=A0ACC3NA49_9PEZI|nr:hypothetical protein LTR37_008739 [Vermiconidia calcicola]
MPLLEETFIIHGGCNCKAVRYEISVPALSDRPPTPYKTPGADIGDLRIPAVVMDHCNDCRRTTSSILPMGLICEAKTVRSSALPKENTSEGAFNVDDILDKLYLAVYKSSPARSRWFCSRCGTMVAYSIDPGVIPPEWGWSAMIDIWLGTVDREDLEKDYMAPERMLWSEKGIPWVRKLAQSGAGGVPEHPLTRIDKLVGDDIEEDLT